MALRGAWLYIHRVLHGDTSKTTEYMSVKFGENMAGDIKLSHTLYSSTLLVISISDLCHSWFLLLCLCYKVLAVHITPFSSLLPPIFYTSKNHMLIFTKYLQPIFTKYLHFVVLNRFIDFTWPIYVYSMEKTKKKKPNPSKLLGIKLTFNVRMEF